MSNIFKAKTTYTLRLRNMETLSVFYSVLVNAANVFRPHYARKISKRNNHWRQKSLSTLSRLRVNHIIIKTVPKFSKCFPSILKRKAGVSKFFRFEEGFWKAPFSWQKSVDGKPIRRKKPQCVSNFSGVVWAGIYHVVGRSVHCAKCLKDVMIGVPTCSTQYVMCVWERQCRYNFFLFIRMQIDVKMFFLALLKWAAA